MLLDGAIAEKLAEPAVAAGGIALATVLVAPGARRRWLRSARSNFRGEVGISAWNGIAVARLCARDGAALRHDLVAIWRRSGTSVPRLWLAMLNRFEDLRNEF